MQSKRKAGEMIIHLCTRKEGEEFITHGKHKRGSDSVDKNEKDQKEPNGQGIRGG